MIKFASQTLPSYVKVTGVKYSILPSIDSKTEKIYGRAGTYDFGIELGERTIEVEVMLIGTTQNDVVNKARSFATWLYFKDLQPLIILDEPDKQYMARVSGETDLTELYRTGTAIIKFLCPSPYAESITEKTVNWSPIDYTPVSITNNGSAETYGVMELTMKSDSTSIAVLSNDKYVKIGDEEIAGMTKVAIDPIILNDSMDTYTGWGTGVSVELGTIAGSLASNGLGLVQLSGDYGSGSSWHGGAGLKTLSKALTDFQVTGRVQLKASNIDQLGRIEIYLLDTNNTTIGKVAISDNSKDGNYTNVQARAGGVTGGSWIVNTYGNKKGVYADFDGVIQISRIGNKWRGYFAKVDSKGVHSYKTDISFIDTNSSYNKQLAKIQVHIGAYGTYTPVSTMSLTDLKVYDKSVTVDTSTQTAILFKAGDKVTIDNQKAVVLKNGEPIFTELDPYSDFFAFEKGANGLILSPPVADVTIRYKERWL